MLNRKAANIAKSTKIAIGRYKERNPSASIREVADKFNVTYDQARNSINKWKEGKLKVTPARLKRKKIAEAQELPTDLLLEKQYKTLLAQLDSDDKMPADARAQMLEKLFQMRKTLQQVKLESHLKKTDAQVFSALVRKFNPCASDEDVITIYREVIESLKL